MRNLFDRGTHRALSSPANCHAGCRGSVHVVGSLLLILALIGAGIFISAARRKGSLVICPKYWQLMKECCMII